VELQQLDPQLCHVDYGSLDRRKWHCMLGCLITSWLRERIPVDSSIPISVFTSSMALIEQ